MTLAEAAALLEDGKRAVAQGATTFDLGGVGQADSSALSLLLAWRRQASQARQPFSVRNPPESVHALAQLYAVDDLVLA